MAPLDTPPTSECLWSFRAFREFPWQNGIVLHASIVENMKKLPCWLDEEPARHTEVDRPLLEAQAKHLASCDLREIYKLKVQKLGELRHILDMPRQILLSPQSTETKWTHDSAAVTNLLFQFQLFDLFADSLGYPSNPSCPNYPKVPPIYNLPINLTKLLGELRDWTRPINLMQTKFDCLEAEDMLVPTMSALTVVPNNELALAPNHTSDAMVLWRQLITLTRALFHEDVSDFHKVLHNFEFASFTATWLSRESWKEVRDVSEVLTIMGRQGVIHTG